MFAQLNLLLKGVWTFFAMLIMISLSTYRCMRKEVWAVSRRTRERELWPNIKVLSSTIFRSRWLLPIFPLSWKWELFCAIIIAKLLQQVQKIRHHFYANAIILIAQSKNTKYYWQYASLQEEVLDLEIHLLKRKFVGPLFEPQLNYCLTHEEVDKSRISILFNSAQKKNL